MKPDAGPRDMAHWATVGKGVGCYLQLSTFGGPEDLPLSPLEKMTAIKGGSIAL